MLLDYYACTIELSKLVFASACLQCVSREREKQRLSNSWPQTSSNANKCVTLQFITSIQSMINIYIDYHATSISALLCLLYSHYLIIKYIVKPCGCPHLEDWICIPVGGNVSKSEWMWCPGLSSCKTSFKFMIQSVHPLPNLFNLLCQGKAESLSCCLYPTTELEHIISCYVKSQGSDVIIVTTVMCQRLEAMAIP